MKVKDFLVFKSPDQNRPLARRVGFRGGLYLFSAKKCTKCALVHELLTREMLFACCLCVGGVAYALGRTARVVIGH